MANCLPDEPYLLFTRYQSNIQQVYLDGSKYRNVYTSGYVRGLDFDFR